MQQLATAIRERIDTLVDQYDARLGTLPGYDRLPEAMRCELERHVLNLIAQCLEADDHMTLVQYVQQRASQWEAQGLDLTWFQQALQVPEEILAPLINSVKDGNFLWLALNRSQSAVWQMVAARAQQTEERFRSIVETSHSGIMITDDQFHFIYTNEQVTHISGYSQAELIGADFRQLLDEDSRRLVTDRYVRRQQGEDLPSNYEIAFIRKDGQKRYVEMSAVLLRDANGKLQTIAQVLDITGHKQAETALTQERNLLRTLIDSLPDQVFVKDAQSRVILNNLADAHALGVSSPEEAIGKSDLDFYPPELAARYHADDMAVIQSGQSLLSREEPGLDENGNQRWLLTTKLPLTDSQGQRIGLVGIARDITAIKRTEQALQESQQFLRLVLDNIPQFVFWKDRNLNYLGCNRNFAQAAGLQEPEQIVGKSDYNLAWKREETAAYRTDDRAVIDSGTPKYHIIEPQLQADGKQAWLDTTKVPLRNTAGEVVGILGMFEDITERRTVEAALRENESKLRAIYEGSNDAIMLLNAQGFFDCNTQTLKLFGVNSKEEFVCLHPSDLSPTHQPDGQDSLTASQQKILTAYQRGYTRFEWIHRRLNGEDFPAEVLLSAFEYGGEQVLQATARDITERKRAEQLLQREKAFSDTVLNGLPGIFYMFDPQGKLLRWNKNLVERLGYSDEEITRLTALDFFPADEREHVASRVGEVFTKGSADVEANFLTKTGEKIPHYLTGLLTIVDGAPYLLGVAVDISERKLLEQQVHDTLQKERVSSERLRTVVNTGYELMRTPDLDSLYREMVELAHTRLGVERCGLFILDDTGEYLEGVYGTDDQGNTIDQRSAANRMSTTQEMEHDLLFAPRERLWTTFDKERTLWIDGEMHGLEKGWNAATVLRGPTGPRGILYNDAAISNAPYEETLQETIALYCTMVGNIIENKRLELNIRESLAHRDTQVQTSTEVAQEIAAAHDLTELLQRVVTSIKERFNYYHAQIFHYAPLQDAVVLVTGYGEAGQKMMAAGHRLSMGRGVVGTAAATGQSILVSDVRQDEDWQPNPHLPDTQGELAVPIKWRDQVLGILDVQSDRVNALTDDDRLLLEGLCGQIASAMESTRLLERTETLYNMSTRLNAAQNYDEILAVLRQYTVLQQADLNISLNLYERPWVGNDMPEWSIVLSRWGVLPSGAASSRYPLKAFSAAPTLLHPDEPTIIADVQHDPRLDAASRELYGKRFGAGSTIFMPLVASGQWIGYVNGIFRQPRTFGEEEVRLLMAATGQASMVIESLHRLADLTTSETQLSGALKIAQLAYWEIDIARQKFIFNDQLYSLLRTTAEAQGGYEMDMTTYVQRFIYPEDIPVVGAYIKQGLQNLNPNAALQFEARVVCADGAVRWLAVQVSTQVNEADQAIKVIGTNQDITERKQAEAKLQELLNTVQQSEQLMRTLIDAMPDHIYAKDLQGRSILANVAEARLHGLEDPEALMGKSDFDFYPPALAEQYFASEQPILRDGVSLLNQEEPNLDVSGHEKWSLTTKIPLRNKQGQIIGLVGMTRDITERKQAEVERERLLSGQQRRALQLQTASEVSRAASSILNAEELLPQAAELIRTRFNFYYVGIFLTDEMEHWAVLRAGTGSAGQQMLNSNHKLKIGGSSMISQCLLKKQAQIALDVGEAAVRFDNPLLPLTRSEIALPLISRARILGAVTIQSEQEAAFTTEDVTALQSMADQIANAVENANLYAQAQAALQEVDAINRRLTGEDWETYLRNQAGRQVLRATDDDEAAPEALSRIDDRLAEGEVVVEPATAEAEAMVTAPILLRGQPIGALRLRTPKNEWNEDTQAILTDIANHIAQAAENARLIEQTQSTAQRERTINEINARVRQSIDLNTILKTAVSELGQSLKAARVVARVGTLTAEDKTEPDGNGRGENNG